MNRNLFRMIFSRRLGMLVPVSEIMKSQGKEPGTGKARGAARSARAIRPRAVTLAVAFALWGEAALASPPLPTGGVITSGAGSITQSGQTLTVNQSTQNMAANWLSFDIAADHSVVFNQPNSSSVALNRVVGPDASAIYGNLSANGHVFLVNPNGVLFAPGAQVNVGGLAASTLNISDEDFAAGRYRFTDGSGAGSVVNEGRINADSVVFVAPHITNNGTVSTPGGRTTFAAGDQVTVSMLNGLLSAQVDVSVADAQIQNHGQILANGGRVDLIAGRADAVLNSLINTDGVIEAHSVREENGRIFLDGGAGGTVTVSGVLDASAPNADQGGEVRVLGDEVTLSHGATIDVSGQRSGGTALVGGDFQGKNAAVLNASRTTVEEGALIRADGSTQGGRVIVWADDTTRFAGDIYARGKGFAEVSGKGTLGFSGHVDTGGGTLLLDPTDITVQSTDGDQDSTFGTGQIRTLLLSNDVILAADNDITWDNTAALDYNGVGNRTLTLQAGSDISYSGTISDSIAGGDSLNVVFNADRDANGTGSIAINTGASIATNGGDITLRGGTAALGTMPGVNIVTWEPTLRATAARGVAIVGATLDAGGGDVTVRGVGVDGTSSARGVLMSNSTIRTNGSGAIAIDGLGGNGTDYNRGVYLMGANNLSTVDGGIMVQGQGAGTGIENSGVRDDNSTIEATGSGAVSVTGLGSINGGTFTDGVVIAGGTVRSNNGFLAVAGTARGTGVGSDGIEVVDGAIVEATGSGNVSFIGASAASGATDNRGVVVWVGATTRSAGGTLSVSGTTSNDNASNSGVSLQNGTIGGASQNGAITIVGDTVNLVAGTIRGSNTLTIAPNSSTATMGVGDGATGTFNLTSAELALIQDGFSSITLGKSITGGTFALDVGDASFSDPVTFLANWFFGALPTSVTFHGTVTGSAGITVNTGAVSLAGATIETPAALSITGTSYTVTGASTLRSSTLAFGNTTAINNTGTLTFDQTSDTTLANAINGTGGNLIKEGANTLVLTGNNGYTGTTSINAGTLAAAHVNALGATSGGTTVASGATLDVRSVAVGAEAVTLNGGTLASATTGSSLAGTVTLGADSTLHAGTGAALTLMGSVSGGFGVTKTGAGTVTLGADNTYNGTTTINAGSLSIGNGGTTGTLGGGAVTNNGTLTFNRSNALTVANTISGSGSLSKQGTGTLTLSGTNTYDGTTMVSRGTLAITNASALGSAVGGTMVTSGTLDLQSVALGGETITLNGFATPGTLTATTGPSSFSGNLVLSSPIATSNVVGAAAGVELTLSGEISGAGRLTKIDAGTVTLTGNNLYSGGTTVSAGTLQIGNGGMSGTFGTGAVTNNASLVFNRSDTLTVANAIDGTGTLTQAGTGTTILSGTNTYGGATAVNAGTLAITNASALGTTAGGTSVGGGATLDLRNVAVDAESLTLAGAADSLGTLTASTGTSSWSGPITLAGPSFSTVSAESGAELTLSGIVSGGGALNKSGTGVVVLTNANTYSSLTQVSAGTLAITNDSALGSTTGSNALTRISIGGTLDLRDVTIAERITGNGGTIEASTGINTISGGLSGFASTPVNVLDGAQLSMTDAIIGSLSLLKNGNGTLILTADNTYTGTTTINAGTVRVGDGGITGTLGTGAVTVASGANLIFDRSDSVNLSTLANNAGGITGQGNVTALIGGDFDVDRAITLTGANSTILLEAGRNNAAGDASGGDVTLNSAISTSATGTVTIFSGNANTAALEAMITGANGPTRYKTYDTAESATAGATAGTRNYYYRQQPTLNVSGLTAIKTYDGLLDATGALDTTGATMSGIDGDAVAAGDVTFTDGTFDNAHAGSRALTATFTADALTYSSGGADWSVSGYAGGTASGTGTITPRAINASAAITAVDKVYDGLLAATGSSIAGTTSGAVAGDTVALDTSGYTLRFDDAHAGTRSVSASGSAAVGAITSTNTGDGISSAVAGQAGDYVLSGQPTVNAAAATITPRALSASAAITAVDKTYDGLVAATGSSIAGTTSGAVAGDSVALDTSGYELRFDDAHAGAHTVSAIGNAGVGAVTSSNTGDGISSAVAGQSSDYVLDAQPTVNAAAATITPRALSASAAITAADKVYDGLLAATGSSIAGTTSGAVAGDTVALDTSGYTLRFDDAHAGTRSVSASGSATVGAITSTNTGDGISSAVAGQAGDYVLSGQPTVNAAAATITPRALNASAAITAADKTYDGLLAATGSSIAGTTSGAVAGDTVALDTSGYTLRFDNAHAGARTVNASGSATLGAITSTNTGDGISSAVAGQAGDYVLGGQPTVSAATATITPRAVTTSIIPVDKTYDGLTGTTSTAGAPSGLVGNDNATGVNGLLFAFDDPNAGTRNIVASGTGTLSGFTGGASGDGSGIGAGNEVAGLASDYTVVAPGPVSAVINPAPLTITANDDAKILTQTDASGYNGVSFSGFVHGEDATVLSGTLVITRSNAGTEAAGDYVGVLVPSGYSSSNYVISYANGNYQILPAQSLLIRIQNVTSSYGTSAAYAITGAEYLDGDGATLRVLTQTAHNGNTYTFSDGLGGSVTFTVTPENAVISSAGYLSAGTYELSGVDASITGNNFAHLDYTGNHTVTPIALTPVAGGVSKVYDGTTAMTGLTMDLTGLLAGDAVGVNASGSFNSRNAGNNVGYAISNIQLTGADAANYYLTTGGFSGTDGVISPRMITASGITANDRIYDGTRDATLSLSGYTLDGVIAGDAVTLDTSGYTALFGDKNVGVGKAVTLSGLGLTGADAGNYLFTQPTQLTASITPRPITLSAIPWSKEYDGTTDALGAVPTTSEALRAGDTFTLLGEQYATADAGTGLTLVPMWAIDDGNGGANYQVTAVNSTAGVITSATDDPSEADDLQKAVAAASKSAAVLSSLAADSAGSKRRASCIGWMSANVSSNDEADGARIAGAGCEQGGTLDDGLVRVVDGGLKLPVGVTSSQHGAR